MSENNIEVLPTLYDCPLPGCGYRYFACPQKMMKYDCRGTTPLDIRMYIIKNPACLCEYGKRCLTGWLIEINKDAPKGHYRTCTDPTCETMLKWGEAHYPKSKDHVRLDFGKVPELTTKVKN